jgi:ADP-ribosylglycohydrolase
VLGCPVETWSASEISQAFGDYPSLPTAYPANLPDPRRKRVRPFGLHSDDTQQALALVSVCLSGWSPKAWGRCLVRGSELLAWRGTGRHFEAAVAKLKGGGAPESSGSPSAGIGAAMRVAPLGALYRDQSRRLSEVALESSAVTHADLRSISLAYAIAFAAGRLVGGAPVMQVRGELADAVAEAEDEWLSSRAKWSVDRAGRHQLSLTLARLFASMPDDVLALGDRVTSLVKPYLQPDFPPAHPNHGFALLGGVYGLAAGLLADAEPAPTLRAIVRQGQDTDTVAAIAGGLLGARFGSGWVPKERLWSREALALYAQALESRAAPPEPLEQLLGREAELSRLERAFQC